MVRIFESDSDGVRCIKEYSEINVCCEGMLSYLYDEGLDSDEVDNLFSRGYYVEGRKHFVIDLDDCRVISEQV